MGRVESRDVESLKTGLLRDGVHLPSILRIVWYYVTASIRDWMVQKNQKHLLVLFHAKSLCQYLQVRIIGLQWWGNIYFDPQHDQIQQDQQHDRRLESRWRRQMKRISPGRKIAQPTAWAHIMANIPRSLHFQRENSNREAIWNSMKCWSTGGTANGLLTSHSPCSTWSSLCESWLVNFAFLAMMCSSAKHAELRWTVLCGKNMK